MRPMRALIRRPSVLRNVCGATSAGWKEHHTNHAAPRTDDTMANYVLEAPDQEAEETHEFNAVIVAEQVASLRTLAVSSAVLELDMTVRQLWCSVMLAPSGSMSFTVVAMECRLA